MGQTNAKAGVIAWGSAEYGQLGLGLPSTETKPYSPTLIDSFRAIPIQTIACNGHHSAALSSSGDIYTWGMGRDGQLGHGDLTDRVSPKLVKSLQGKTVHAISCGEHHTAVCLEDGTVYTWGRNANGRLGIGKTELLQRLPMLVEALMGTFVSAVSCGGFHSLFLTLPPLSSVYSCGLGLSGRLGHGDESERLWPTCITVLEGLSCISICAGTHHSACVTKNGHLYTWGGSAFGKLGLGYTAAQLVPKRVKGVLSSQIVTHISLGSQHSVCISSLGDVYSWGQGGRLGHSPQGECDECYPRQIVALAGLFVLQVSCGHSHTVAVLETGHHDVNTAATIPTCIRSLMHSGVHQVCCGESSTLALSNYKFLTEKAASATAALRHLEKYASKVILPSLTTSSSVSPLEVLPSEVDGASSPLATSPLEFQRSSETFPSHTAKSAFFHAFNTPQQWPLHFDTSQVTAASKEKSSFSSTPSFIEIPPSQETKQHAASTVHTPPLSQEEALPSTTHFSMASLNKGDIDGPSIEKLSSLKEGISDEFSITAALHTRFHSLDQKETAIEYYKELAFLNARLRSYEQQQSVLMAALQKATHD
ncbi:regulator of chromosome condensation (RCC1) repeat-containing protein, partial [Cardiosporidium cionae]